MHAQTLPSPQAFSATHNRQTTVLVVDDDTDVVEVLRVCLGKQGYRVLGATRGSVGLQIARSERPDVILLDLRLPDLDGFAVGQELTDDPDTCQIPVIVVSGMERPDIIRRARAAGCHYYIRKPYDPNALLVLIEHALRESAL